MDKVTRQNSFKNNFPGKGWYKAFLKRHNEISLRTAEAVSSANSKVSEKDIRACFEGIYKYLVKEGLDHISNDPTGVYNVDEMGFQICPQIKNVLAPRGTRNVLLGTVMFTFSASGCVTPPMTI